MAFKKRIPSKMMSVILTMILIITMTVGSVYAAESEISETAAQEEVLYGVQEESVAEAPEEGTAMEEEVQEEDSLLTDGLQEKSEPEGQQEDLSLEEPEGQEAASQKTAAAALEEPIPEAVREVQDMIDALPDSVDALSASSFDEEFAIVDEARGIIEEIWEKIGALSDEDAALLDTERFSAYEQSYDELFEKSYAIGRLYAGGSSSGLSFTATVVCKNHWAWSYQSSIADDSFTLSNGEEALCACGGLSPVPDGATVTISEYTGVNAEWMKKILYYGANGPAAIPLSSYHYWGTETTFSDAMMQTCYALSYVYTGVDLCDLYTGWPYFTAGQTLANQLWYYDAVPSGYKLYMCDPGNSSQQTLFYLVYEEPTGTVTLQKSSTDSTYKQSLYGALYSVYDSSNKWMGSFITGSDGTGWVVDHWSYDKDDLDGTGRIIYYDKDKRYYQSSSAASKILTLEPGTYTLYERIAPDGYMLNTGSSTFTVTAGDNTPLTSGGYSVLGDIPAIGTITLKKSTGVSTSKYSLEGALYSIRNNDSSKSWTGYTFITDREGTGYVTGKAYFVTSKSDIPSGRIYAEADGGYYYSSETTTLSIKEGIYYLREVKAPSCGDFLLNSGDQSFTVTAGKTNSLTSSALSILKDDLKVGYIALRKSSQALSFCESNSLYSLEGAVYKVYNSVNLTDANCVATLTTDENGDTEAVKLIAGTYYIKETKASPGHELDATTHRAVLTNANTETDPLIVTSTDPVKNDPLAVTVTKQSAVDYIYALPLEGVTFKICYYDNLDGDTTGTPLRTWTISTKLNASLGLYRAGLDTDYLVAGSDDLYKINEKAVLPIGTYTMQEMSTANGYKIAGGTMQPIGGAAQSSESVYTFVVNEFDGAVTVNVGNEFTGTNIPVVISTEAAAAGKHYIDAASGAAVIDDAVSLSNLNAGASYRLTSTLYDTSNSNAIVGTAVVNEFTAEAATAKKTVSFNITDASAYKGHRLVVGQVLEQYLEDAWVSGEHVQNAWVKMGEETDLTGNDLQAVNIVSVSTTLTDKNTSDNVAKAGGTTFVDMVAYEGLAAGTAYTLQGSIIDKATGEKVASAESTFTAAASSGTITLEFALTAEQDKTYVAYEYLYEGTVLIASHADINDEAQTVTVPDVRTTLKDSTDGAKDAEATESITLVDTVKFTNLVVGKTYTVEGKLYDKATGEPALDDDGNEITASAQYTTDKADGSVDITFSFSGVCLAGHSVVAFETVKHNNVKVCTHADINDDDQTVDIPKIGTTLTDSTDGEKDACAQAYISLIDTVAYENLTAGETYTVEGALFDRATGEQILDDSGSVITATRTFTAKSSKGSVDITFEFSGSALKGKTLVAYEYLYRGDKEVASHEDLNDEGQTVHIPEIGTTLTDKTDGDHDALADDEITLIDTVVYRNLTAGKTYSVHGILIDAETGMELLDDEGNFIQAQYDFTAETASGSVNLEFTFAGTTVKGHSAVAFETLYRGEKKVAVHEDLTDKGQTVDFPEAKTTLLSSGAHVAYVTASMVLVDTVAYSKLTAGKTYTVTGTLMDKATGEPAIDDAGNEITADAEFTPETGEGTVELTFTFSGLSLVNHTMVAFEHVYRNGKEVAVHADIDDADQTVHIVSIGTTLTGANGLKNALNGETEELTDAVECHNLIPGDEYTISGVLVDRETGEYVNNADGQPVTAETTFVAEAEEQTVDIVFVLDSVPEEGLVTVAYETLLYNGKKIADHEDIDDEGQTVWIPGIKTTLVSSDGLKTVNSCETITLVDTVSYKNLKAGTQYILKGMLMDKATGEKAMDAKGNEITAETIFTSEAEEGTEEVTFTFTAAEEFSAELVAYEYVFEAGTLVADHEDIDDEDQTVEVLTLKTVAAFVGGAKKASYAQTNTVTDTITYSSLTPGTYRISGSLIDKSTGKTVATAERTVKLTEKSGTVTLEFSVPANTVTTSAVVYEEFYYDIDGKAVLVGEHKDINDEDQTVTFYNPSNPPKTGDDSGFGVYLYIVLGALAVFTAALVMILRKRSER